MPAALLLPLARSLAKNSTEPLVSVPLATTTTEQPAFFVELIVYRVLAALPARRVTLGSTPTVELVRVKSRRVRSAAVGKKLLVKQCQETKTYRTEY